MVAQFVANSFIWRRWKTRYFRLTYEIYRMNVFAKGMRSIKATISNEAACRKLNIYQINAAILANENFARHLFIFFLRNSYLIELHLMSMGKSSVFCRGVLNGNTFDFALLGVSNSFSIPSTKQFNPK